MKPIKFFLCSFLAIILFSSHILFAQVDTSKKILPEPKFTWNDSNIVIIDVPPGSYKYELKYGLALENSIFSPNPIFELGPLEIKSIGWRNYFKGFVYDLGTDELLFVTRPDSAFSLQDEAPPYLIHATIDTFEIKPDEKVFIGPITQNRLSLKISDLQYFKYHDIVDWRNETFTTEDSIWTGSGISAVNLNRNSSLFFDWDTTLSSVSDTLRPDTTFVLPDAALTTEGEYFFEIEMADGTFQPDQSKNPKIKGNVGTDSFIVVYDISNPTIDVSKLKNIYSSSDVIPNSPDSILLEVTFNDNLAGIDTSTFDIDNVTFSPQLEVLDHQWVDCAEPFTLCSLKIWVAVVDDDYTARFRISDRSKNMLDTTAEFSIKTASPKILDFRIVDLDSLNDTICFIHDADYTNSDSVIVDSIFTEGNPDFLRIKGDIERVIPIPMPSDTLLLSWFYPNYSSSDTLNLRITAMDSLGNEQDSRTAPIKFIVFDNDPLLIEDLQITDLFPVDQKKRNGAYNGWTNDQKVNVAISVSESDPYRVKEISPNDTCFNYQQKFLDSIPSLENKSWQFTYSVGDSAGNPSNESDYIIKLDTEIYQPMPEDFIIRDPSSNSSVGTDEDSVIIEFYATDSVMYETFIDLSRIIVDEKIYDDLILPESQNDILQIKVPVTNKADTIKFSISIVDSAGNESMVIEKSIHHVSDYILATLLVEDYSPEDYPALPSWTNDDSVLVIYEFDPSGFTNFILDNDTLIIPLIKLEQAVKYDTLPIDSIKNNKIYCRYKLPQMNLLNQLEGKIIGLLQDMGSNPEFDQIIHDGTKPLLVDVGLRDTSDVVESEITDDSTIYIDLSLADTTYDAYEVLITEENPAGEITSKILPFESTILWDLSDGTDNYVITAAIIDSAGNLGNSVSDTIRYLNTPPFEFVLFDTSSNPFPADSGFTNDTAVQLRIFAKDTILANIKTIVFYDSTKTDSVVISSPPADSLLHLDLLYNNLNSCNSYKVTAKIILTGNIVSDKAQPFSIKYDNVKPNISSFELIDPTPMNDSLYVELIAKSGWTNQKNIAARLTVSDDCVLKKLCFDGDSSFCLEDPNETEYVNLHIKNIGINTVSAYVTDKAGNKSIVSTDSIIYFSQEIQFEIDTTDIVYVDNSTVDQTTNTIKIPIDIISGDSLWWAFTWNDENDSLNYRLPGDTLLFPVPTDSGFVYAALADLSGTFSNIDSVYLVKRDEPEITLMLYDYSEFPLFTSPTSQLPPDWERSDSQYTDEMNEHQKLVALIELTAGDWDSIRIASCDTLMEVDYLPVANSNSNFDIRDIPFPANVGSLDLITLCAQAKNNAGIESEPVQFTIIHDIVPPVLNFVEPVLKSLNGPQVVSDSNYTFSYSGFDEAPGELAGIIVYEMFNEKTKFSYIAEGEEKKIILFPERGERTLCAYLVDKADVDQNRPDSLLARLKRKNDSKIDHPSENKCFKVRLNPKEVSNFPNPFNPNDIDPERKYTKLLFPLNKASHVKITILDAFGNLVKSWDTQGIEGLNSGDTNKKLRWYGLNGNKDKVANGGYICIIKSDAGEKHIRKIAVAKK